MESKVMSEFYAIGNNYKFIEVDELYGHTSFADFEKEHDDNILYAYMDMVSVSNALVEPIDIGTDMSLLNVYHYSLELYLFDGWYIALK